MLYYFTTLAAVARHNEFRRTAVFNNNIVNFIQQRSSADVLQIPPQTPGAVR